MVCVDFGTCLCGFFDLHCACVGGLDVKRVLRDISVCVVFGWF